VPVRATDLSIATTAQAVSETDTDIYRFVLQGHNLTTPGSDDIGDEGRTVFA
jgi:hypothetical protein